MKPKFILTENPDRGLVALRENFIVRKFFLFSECAQGLLKDDYFSIVEGVFEELSATAGNKNLTKARELVSNCSIAKWFYAYFKHYIITYKPELLDVMNEKPLTLEESLNILQAHAEKKRVYGN